MTNLEERILAEIAKKNYHPLKAKALARKLGVSSGQYIHFRQLLRGLAKQGRLEFGRNQTVRQAGPHGTAGGIFRKAEAGFGFVRPHAVNGTVGPEIFIPEAGVGDAVTGDEVLVRIRRQPRRPNLGPSGEILQVLQRATRQFVGTYFERDGDSFVRVDGTVFSHSIYVGDPGAKGARLEDKVVIEMLRFPGPEDRGEGVITEVLGPRGKPGVDTLSIIRAFGLPDKFPEEALAEARAAADNFDENDLDSREDLTRDITITIDPADARDFDDAISLTQDSRSKHWLLGVHIADVSHFVAPGGELDREARKRATSVYLPQRVLPMFPEIISNHLASLQHGRVRYVKSVFIDYTPAGIPTAVRFANAAIRVRRRFNYEEVSAILARHPGEHEDKGRARKASRKTPEIEPEIGGLLSRMRDLAMILRQRRIRRGSLQLEMPETELEYDDQGRVTGAHFLSYDVSHQLIEEFMLAANEAVAQHLDDLEVSFLRRVHPAPDETKLRAFGDFARTLGYKIKRDTDRFSLQRVLDQASKRPDVFAVNYALLRSLKQAVYSPQEEEHYALASRNYCHFTSPIRRYPDLTVHRLLDQWLKSGRAGADQVELAALGDHCSKMERRADVAERELIRVKLLTFLGNRIGMQLDAIITGVADYGFFAQGEELPVEGLIHVSTLTDDFYYFEEAAHSLIGKRTKRRFRLGDKVRVKVVRVDLQRRQLDFRVVRK